MNILFITGRYGKNAAANGICVKSVIDTLVEDNNVYCLCYDDFVSENYNKEIVIKVRRGFLHSSLYRSKDAKSTQIINNLIKFRNLFFLPVWPWIDPIYTLKVYMKARRICKEKNIDMVIGVHMPLSSLIVANKLKKKNRNIKYIAYFLDSLSGGNPLSILSRKWNLKSKIQWEKKVLKNADKIIVMESSRKHHELYNKDSYFYNDLIYLDVPLLKNRVLNCTSSDYLDKTKINIVYCGTANYPLRNVPYLLDIISKIESENIIFHFFGNSNCDKLTKSTLNNVKFHGAIVHEKIISILNDADFFLNLGTKETSTISGKIFEYMSYGKPIISSYSIDDESCIKYLKKYGNYYLYDERQENIELQAKNMKKYIESNLKAKVDIDEVKINFKNNLPETFRKEILGGNV